jgi:membrane associated rhomboid family serine protease
MIKFLRRCCESKRECITYLVVFLWVVVGVIASYFETNFTDLAAYFVSLTGFIAAYIFGESVRKSSKTSIFLEGPTSKREAMMYITIVLWLIVGLWVIVKNADLMGMSAYFAALTPFVGSYIIGETFKKEEDHESSEADEQINS